MNITFQHFQNVKAANSTYIWSDITYICDIGSMRVLKKVNFLNIGLYSECMYELCIYVL